MCHCLVGLLCSLLFVACQQGAEGERGNAIVTNAPSIHGETYECGKMIKAVNDLRVLGKEKSLAVLRQYLLSDGETAKVLVICRLLFVNPKGWDAPSLGQAVPAIDKSVAKRFPLFPMALEDRVPFLLIQGYRAGGKGESAMKCLQFCETLSLITEDYPLSGYEKAGRALIQSESFRGLYEKKDLRQMADMITRQANAAK